MNSISNLLGRSRRYLGSAWSRIRKKRPLHSSIRKYIRFNRELWGPPPESVDGAVFLVGIFRWFPLMPGYACLANHFARKASASIEWFNFYGRRDREVEQIFTSFGARPGLSLELEKVDEESAKQAAEGIFSSIQSKWDVMGLKVDGVWIGDLVYDTYLRVGPHTTVDIRDPQLAAIILQAVRITRSCLAYFARKKVVGVIPDHFTYIYTGIVTRCAVLAGIPVYQVLYGPNFYAYSVSYDKENGYPVRLPCPFYRELFSRLTPVEQEAAREKGRRVIQRRLGGHEDGILSIPGSIYGKPVVKSAYASAGGESVLESTGRPRILVLMHDFCDAVHYYRDMLFPDFYEWLHFLLKHANETEFDWYVKAHPNTAREGKVSTISNEVLQELKAKYPRIRFLPATTSSLQIIQEGISSLFTVYGTAGQEFAYLGVPVVNAGDNQHISYDFNLHPRTLEEYVDCIQHADSLKVNIRKEVIEEHIYMHYIYREERLSSDVNPMPESFFASDEYKQHRSRPETLEGLMHRLTAEEKAELARYFDHLPHLSAPLSVDVRKDKTTHRVATVLKT